MSEGSQLVLMARYNALMNRRMLDACGDLDAEALREDRGAFFGSVWGTLNHIMVADIMWLKRFSRHPSGYAALRPLDGREFPQALNAILMDDLDAFRAERAALDGVIIDWCTELKGSDLDRPFRYTNYKGELHNKRLGDLVLHLFLHQIHHRGQVTTLLSQADMDFGETDLPEIVPDVGGSRSMVPGG